MKTTPKADFSLYDTLPMPISVIDTEGRLLYYNPAASAIFERKPELIGRDVRRCHSNQASVARIDELLERIKDRESPPAIYEIERKGRNCQVIISRLEIEGELVGAIQCVLPLGPASGSP